MRASLPSDSPLRSISPLHHMHRWMRSLAIASIAAGPTLTSTSSWAQADLRIDALLETGEWVSGGLAGIDGGRWRVGDREVAERAIVAFTASPAGNARSGTLDGRIPPGAGVVELWNGQQLPGVIKVQPSGTVWDHRWIGPIPFVVDRVSSLRLRGRKLPERRADADAVLLANGDVATGFVESLGTDLVYEPADGAGGQSAAGDGAAADGRLESTRRVPLDRVAAVVFAAVASEANTTAQSAAMQLTTADGSRVLGRNLRFAAANPDQSSAASADGGWSFELADPELSAVRKSDTSDNAAANVVAGVLQPSRLRAFTALGEPKVAVPDGAFHYGVARSYAALEADAQLPQLSRFRIAGPVVAEFSIGASPAAAPGPICFTAEVSLEQPAPADARVELTLQFGSASADPIVLDARNPRRRIAITDPSGAAASLVVRLGDGGNGIAGDVVLFERACLIAPAR